MKRCASCQLKINISLRSLPDIAGRIGPVPTLGQHTDEVLSRILGYSRATLEELRQAKVIA